VEWNTTISKDCTAITVQILNGPQHYPKFFEQGPAAEATLRLIVQPCDEEKDDQFFFFIFPSN
jgi:hypothetical protein